MCLYKILYFCVLCFSLEIISPGLLGGSLLELNIRGWLYSSVITRATTGMLSTGLGLAERS